MDVIAVSSLCGVIGLAGGVVGTAFAFGRRYSELLNHREEIIERQDALEENFQKCQEKETIHLREVGRLLKQCNDSMTTLGTAVAVLNTNLLNVPKQEDIMKISDRLSHVEGILNHKERGV